MGGGEDNLREGASVCSGSRGRTQRRHPPWVFQYSLWVSTSGQRGQPRGIAGEWRGGGGQGVAGRGTDFGIQLVAN